MKILITGGTGFIGRQLSLRLLNDGHQVIVAGSRLQPNSPIPPGTGYFQFNPEEPALLREVLRDADAIVNLAGKSIFCWWSAAAKQRIYHSRVLTTRRLMEALPQDRPLTVLSASAAGYYGDCGDASLTEKSPDGSGFLAEVCRDWEDAVYALASDRIRAATMRFGVVLGKGGGAMAQMLPAFRWFLGGPLGSGAQWFPWIHLEDLIAAIQYLLAQPELSGPFNFTAPVPARQKEFAATLGQALNRPAILPVPQFVMRSLLGEFGASLIASQKALPERLQRCQFNFRYPDIRSAVMDITR